MVQAKNEKKKFSYPKVRVKKDEIGAGYIPMYDTDAVIPKVDTKAGPGLENIDAALDKDVDPLLAFNSDEEK
ncbi:hypothetical protein [Desulfoscipio geothermicus]|uniref:Uncharacterized protein n=1 Tax=Desulfoscipio geothermicus DSM 3669 TaxID=1121426 RepID=A0A1I6EJ11_9FIRM|nr:hypothetical protein [Desulfoscipio geothermicus]SFR17729.1 hypothetical protein SAMN05660706_1495 [Desulfoscipio geothermicus DSM 3669]